tara:strand:+ start:805 stop:939 length:135 start_codon:yes stop_codon:yes gene_type:complete
MKQQIVKATTDLAMFLAREILDSLRAKLEPDLKTIKQEPKNPDQ